MNKEIQNLIIEKAFSLGFSLVSFTSPKVADEDIDAYEKWLSNKYNADLAYMENSKPRQNTSEILKGVKTVITLATNYNKDSTPLKKGFLKIAKYAQGRDYHKFIKKRLKKLEEFLKILFPQMKSRSFVDAVPILERAFAKNSGIGIIGKNSCIITKEYGSFVFLSEILTDIYLGENTALSENKDFSICGSCSLCMDFCPTKAIVAPGVIDASKCIAYHTIESKKPIPEKFVSPIKNSKYLFGCDICQLVCPHNAGKPISQDPEICNNIAGDQLEIDKLRKLKTEEEFLNNFKGSPLMRAKLKGIQRILDIHSSPLASPENIMPKQKTNRTNDSSI